MKHEELDKEIERLRNENTKLTRHVSLLKHCVRVQQNTVRSLVAVIHQRRR